MINLGLGCGLAGMMMTSSLLSSEVPGSLDSPASSTSLSSTCLLAPLALQQASGNSLFCALAAAAATAFSSHATFLSAFWCSFSHLCSSCSQSLSCAFLALSCDISASFLALSSSFLVHSALYSHTFSSATKSQQYFS